MLHSTKGHKSLFLTFGMRKKNKENGFKISQELRMVSKNDL